MMKNGDAGIFPVYYSLKGCLNHRGLVCGCTVFIFNNAVQRGNGYDLPDNSDKCRSGGKADVARWLLAIISTCEDCKINK